MYPTYKTTAYAIQPDIFATIGCSPRALISTAYNIITIRWSICPFAWGFIVCSYNNREITSYQWSNYLKIQSISRSMPPRNEKLCIFVGWLHLLYLHYCLIGYIVLFCLHKQNKCFLPINNEIALHAQVYGSFRILAFPVYPNSYIVQLLKQSNKGKPWPKCA